MRRPPGLVLFAVVTLACSSLPSIDNGIVALEVRSPLTDTLELGDTLKFSARALNGAGDSVATNNIIWRTADTLLVTVIDSLHGTIVALSDTGVARIQASIGTLNSDLILVTLQPDTATTTTSTSVRIIR